MEELAACCRLAPTGPTPPNQQAEITWRVQFAVGTAICLALTVYRWTLLQASALLPHAALSGLAIAVHVVVGCSVCIAIHCSPRRSQPAGVMSFWGMHLLCGSGPRPPAGGLPLLASPQQYRHVKRCRTLRCQPLPSHRRARYGQPSGRTLRRSGRTLRGTCLTKG